MTHKRRRAVAAVELALIAPVLLLILFAFIELSWLLSDVFILEAAARAGAREAALGGSTTAITTRVQSAAAGLDASALTVSMSYRVEAEAGWGPWQPLGDTVVGSSTVNDAPAGAQVRVSLSYAHRVLLPGFFPGIGDASNPSVHTITVTAVMRRE